jgi:uncharacterized protein (TIGR00369 family)
MLKDYWKQLRKPDQTVNRLFGFLGVTLESLSPERVVLGLPFREEFLQGAGVVAGGIMAALADEAMAHLVLMNLEEDRTTATIEMNLRFLKPLKKGGLKAEAVIVKKGRQVFTVAADVRDEAGQLLAQAGASFIIVEPR